MMHEQVRRGSHREKGREKNSNWEKAPEKQRALIKV